MNESKACTKCGETKPLDAFHKRTDAPDGRRSDCRDCRNAVSRAWYSATLEHQTERKRKYRKENPEKMRESWRKSNQKNGAARSKAWRSRGDNATRSREASKKWRAENPERMRELRRAWASNNVVKMQAYAAATRARREATDVRLITVKDMRRILTTPCIGCGSTDDPSIDHSIPMSRGGRHSIGNLLPLCRSCNSRKGNRTFMEWRARATNTDRKVV